MSLCEHISQVTGIDTAVLRGSDPTDRTIAERMSWAASRSTTRVEDAAYSLMGLFNVFMPMLYGEGSRAFTRLQEEIMKQSEDYTIFAWKASFLSSNNRGLLANSPDEFLGSANNLHKYYKADHDPEIPPSMTSRGLLIDLPLWPSLEQSTNGMRLAWVCFSKHAESTSGSISKEGTRVCIWLKRVPSRPQTYVRILPDKLQYRSRGIPQFVREQIYVLPFGALSKDEAPEAEPEIDKTISGMIQVRFPQEFDAQQLKAPASQLFKRGMSVEWNPGTNELLYSYDGETCALAALTLEKQDDRFAVFFGFRENLPWCSIVTWSELHFPASNQWERPDAVEKLFDAVKSPYADQTDRSSKQTPDGSTITAALRVGCSTPLNPTIFNLDIKWNTSLRSQVTAVQVTTVPSTSQPEHRVVSAPTPYTKTGSTVFLSGTISPPPTWQDTLTASLSHLQITILNPLRLDWDSSWKEDLSDARFVEQTNWELDGMENADIIAMYFGPEAKAPVTLLELGLFAQMRGKVIVCCPEGYWKRCNVQVVCGRYGIEILNTIEELGEAVIERISELGKHDE